MHCSVNPLKLEDGKRLSQDGYEEPDDSRVGQASPAVDNNFVGNSEVLLDWSPSSLLSPSPLFPWLVWR